MQCSMVEGHAPLGIFVCVCVWGGGGIYKVKYMRVLRGVFTLNCIFYWQNDSNYNSRVRKNKPLLHQVHGGERDCDTSES